MPIATPEVYADAIRRAKEGGFAYPAINCLLGDGERRPARLRRRRERRDHPVLDRRREFASGTKVKDMVTGAVATAGSPTSSPRSTR